MNRNPSHRPRRAPNRSHLTCSVIFEYLNAGATFELSDVLDQIYGHCCIHRQQRKRCRQVLDLFVVAGLLEQKEEEDLPLHTPSAPLPPVAVYVRSEEGCSLELIQSSPSRRGH